MKNQLLPYLIMIIIYVVLLKEINTLKETIEYQSNYIEEIDNNVLKPLGISKD